MTRSRLRCFVFLICFLLLSLALLAQTQPSIDEVSSMYQALKNSSPFERTASLENVRLERDRVSITFESGTVYFPAPVGGKIRSAVFVGSGTVKASPPPVPFEKENLRRMIHQEELNTNFKSAVLRFTDNTADELLGYHPQTGSISAGPMVDDALSVGPRLLKETGANIAARQLESILNNEDPGMFFIQFEGGKLGRFSYIFDPQDRIPACKFGIDAGEKGVVFAYDPTIFSNDVWLAFHGQEAFTNRSAPYADAFNMVETPHYKMVLDLQEPHKVLGLTAELEMVSRVNDLRAISFMLGEGLDIYEDERRKKQLQVSSVQLADGTPLKFFQEPWETGFTVVLPQTIASGQKFSLKMEMKGDFMKESQYVTGTYFPRSTETWYPRHGVLGRSSFDVSMIHRKRDHVVSVGEFVRESAAPDNANANLTEFRLSNPVSFITFAVGPYEIHKDVAKQADGKELPLEFYSMPGRSLPVKEDFILAEMNNSIRYFSKLFGPYPYPIFRGVFHPFNFGQGFPTTIMIPAADTSGANTFSFIAHETSHQWWGDVVYWRSYRDQWLSEGFAEYSGMLYTELRDKTKSEKDLIRRDRDALKLPARNLTGMSSERLTDIGPLVLGRRLETRETRGAYTALVYNKGGLVLRMLHFLFTDPSTGNGQAFFDFMTDFVNRYRDQAASTEQFFKVANEHVINTPNAQKYGYKDLNWFYWQWVMQTYLPSYELTYHVEADPSGGVLIKGEVATKGLPDGENWFMPLPLVLRFSNGGVGRGTVAAQGSHTPFTIKLSQAPEKVELDPDMWVLSAKTSTSKN